MPEGTSPDPVILIHGAWQGSWAWARLLPYLEAAGIEAHAIDLPGNGTDDTPPEAVTLDAYLDNIEVVIDRMGKPVSLVGHSGGGIVATAAAERFREQVNAIAYVAGMMLPPGMSFGELQNSLAGAEGHSPGITPWLEWNADHSISAVPPDPAIHIFYHDCDLAGAEEAAARLVPQPEGGRNIAADWTPKRFGTLPRLYIEAENDRSVVLMVQRRMQELVPGAVVKTLPTGHAPQLARPDLLAAALIPFLISRS